MTAMATTDRLPLVTGVATKTQRDFPKGSVIDTSYLERLHVRGMLLLPSFTHRCRMKSVCAGKFS